MTDAMTHARRGLVMVISSPSGAGKTSITRALLDSDDHVHLSISATTRPQRPGERDKHHYHFMSDAQFKAAAHNGEMLEHARVFGHAYGTPKKPVQDSLTAGQDVLLDIDWQGAAQLRKSIPDDLVTVFLLPPSARELYRRLSDRKRDSDEVIADRMRMAGGEIYHWDEYNYVLINDVFDQTLDSIKNILHAERQRRFRQTHMQDFVQDLLRGIKDLPF